MIDFTKRLPPLRGTMGMVMRARWIRERHWRTFQRSLTRNTHRKLTTRELSFYSHIDWMFRSWVGRDSTFWLEEVCGDHTFEVVIRLLEAWHVKKCPPPGSEEGEVIL
jgi:hypothetical protein